MFPHQNLNDNGQHKPETTEQHRNPAVPNHNLDMRDIYHQMGEHFRSAFNGTSKQGENNLHMKSPYPDFFKELGLDGTKAANKHHHDRGAAEHAAGLPEHHQFEATDPSAHHSRHHRYHHHAHRHHHGHPFHRRGHGHRHGHGEEQPHHPGSADAGHHFAGGAYDGIKEPNHSTLATSVKAVLEAAHKLGLSPAATRAAVASMLTESRGNPHAIGDGGTSFGLFQLHRGGELTEAHLTPQQAFDPKTNAEVALRYFKQMEHRYSDAGQLAAAAQRPKNRAEYAAKVDSLLGQADRLIRMYGGSGEVSA